MSYRFALTLLASVALCACGGDDDDDHTDPPAEEDPEAHACEHLEEGPFQQVAAAADAAMAPGMTGVHVTYDVTLQDDGAGNFGGFAAYTAAEAAEFMFFVDTDVPIAFLDAAGAALTPEGTCSADPCSAACALIQGKYMLDLGAATYTLSFGPTPAQRVRVLVEEAHHDHAH